MPSCSRVHVMNDIGNECTIQNIDENEAPNRNLSEQDSCRPIGALQSKQTKHLQLHLCLLHLRKLKRMPLEQEGE